MVQPAIPINVQAPESLAWHFLSLGFFRTYVIILVDVIQFPRRRYQFRRIRLLLFTCFRMNRSGDAENRDYQPVHFHVLQCREISHSTSLVVVGCRSEQDHRNQNNAWVTRRSLKQQVDYYQNKRRYAEKPGNEIFTHNVSSLKSLMRNSAAI